MEFDELKIIPGEQARRMRLAVNQYRAGFDSLTRSQIMNREAAGVADRLSIC